MTVETTTTKQQFTLNQVASQFDFTFRALTTAATDIKARATTGSTETLLTYTTDYTVTISTDGIGGNLWLVDKTAVSKGTLTVYRDTTDKQESDYDDYNQFPAQTLETDLDKRTMKSQELEEANDRALVLPISVTGVDAELPVPVASQVIGWNSSADGMSNYDNAATSVTAAASYATTAAGSATDSANSATTSGTSATASASSGTVAASEATTAVTAAATIPSPVGQTVANQIRVNAGQDAYELFTPGTATNFNINRFTRNVALASGTQSVTGIGFLPTHAIFLQGINADHGWSIGMDDITTSRSLYSDWATSNGDMAWSGNDSIFHYASAGNSYAGDVTSYDADGFTIDWFKTGTPTGTTEVVFLVMR